MDLIVNIILDYLKKESAQSIYYPYQSCHEKRRFDISFSDPLTQVRNVAPWQTLADKVKQ